MLFAASMIMAQMFSSTNDPMVLAEGTLEGPCMPAPWRWGRADCKYDGVLKSLARANSSVAHAAPQTMLAASP